MVTVTSTYRVVSLRAALEVCNVLL